MRTSPSARVVYIVDADPSVREGMARLLTSAGLESRPCPSIESFLHEAAGVTSACALLDLGAGGLGKPALQSRLQAVAALMPLIAITADDGLVARQRAREIGACACFRKPVDAAALLDAILWVTQSPAPFR